MNDQHVMAIAMIVQDVLLVVSAVLVGWYLCETRKLRIAAQEQLEAQTRPALVVRLKKDPTSRVVLVNHGNGPALDVILSPADRGAGGSRRWLETQTVKPGEDLSYIEVGGERVTTIRTLPPATGFVLAGKSLQSMYKSLSGRTYFTVVDFDMSSNDRITATRFNSEEIPR